MEIESSRGWSVTVHNTKQENKNCVPSNVRNSNDKLFRLSLNLTEKPNDVILELLDTIVILETPKKNRLIRSNEKEAITTESGYPTHKLRIWLFKDSGDEIPLNTKFPEKGYPLSIYSQNKCSILKFSAITPFCLLTFNITPNMVNCEYFKIKFQVDCDKYKQETELNFHFRVYRNFIFITTYFLETK